MTDIRTILRRTTRDLTACGSPSPRLDAEVLLMHFLKTDRLQLCTHPERILTEAEAAGFARWVERRRRGEPVAYIVGEKEFWSLRLRGQPRGPHPEAGDGMPHRRGPGALSAGGGRTADHRYRNGERRDRRRPGAEIPAARVVATDISTGALEVARRNAVLHGVAGRMEFLHGDLFASAPGIFDLHRLQPALHPR